MLSTLTVALGRYTVQITLSPREPKGITLRGISNSLSGFAVANAGDINLDGLDDVLISAPSAINESGQSYVIFGNSAPVASVNAVIPVPTMNRWSLIMLAGLTFLIGLMKKSRGTLNTDPKQ